ncbi:MAG: IPT/TIG domain-containing protein [Maribacter sp.]|uniref:IPT/TIG domain-containing protein n=1 Tax=Maribacter sp. TaxID=1897614 RepID=UPI003C78765D
MCIFFACSKEDSTTTQEPEPAPTLAATLSSIDPESAAKEAEITLTGENFGTDKNKVKVFFNAVEAIVQSVTNTEIKTIAPANASSGAIKIIVNGTTIDGPVFTFLQPTLNSIAPEIGPKGTEVTFTGANFGSDATKAQVFFTTAINGETRAVLVSITNTEVVVEVPSDAATGNVRMVVDDIELAGPTFTVFGPAISSFTPESGPKGTEVTINGEDFGTDQNLVSVFFNDKPALIKSVSDTEIIAIVPSGAQTGLVKAIVDGFQLSGAEFTYVFTVEVSTIAGSVEGYEDGVGSVAKFAIPRGITTDALGNIFIADRANGRIRKITPDGIVSSLAGGIGTNSSIDGQGSTAGFFGVEQLTIDVSGNVIATEQVVGKIRQIGPDDGITSTITNLLLNPTGIVIDNFENIFVADDRKIFKIDPNGTISTLAGSNGGFADGLGVNAQFQVLSALAIDASGNIYAADQANNRIRKITPNGQVTTIAGSTIGFADGPAISAQFNNPTGITVDKQGNLYIVDSENNRIRKITPEGQVSTVAGSTSGFSDGDGATAQFNRPRAITIDADGNLLVTDTDNARIRKISFE